MEFGDNREVIKWGTTKIPEQQCTNAISILTVLVSKRCLNGCISVLYRSSDIAASVRDEEVANNVAVAGNNLHKVDPNGHVLLFSTNTISSGMLISGVNKSHKARFTMKRLPGTRFKCLNLQMIVMTIALPRILTIKIMT